MDIKSTDAMYWAKELVATAKKNNFTLDEVLDESWLVGWFANYWAAVHDPLQAEVERLNLIVSGKTFYDIEKETAVKCAEIVQPFPRCTIKNPAAAIRKEFGIEGSE